MKTKIMNNIMAKSLILGLMVCLGFYACEQYPDEFEKSGGSPEVSYIRTPDIASADSLLDAGYLNNSICIVGKNLKSVHKIFFNDQEAILNTSFITENTLIVTIPKGIPEDVTNKMYLHNYAGDIVEYPFKVKVPAPIVASMVCEYVADGDVAVIKGDYLIDDPNVPMTITMNGNIPVTEITPIDRYSVQFVVPEGAQGGYINVSTIYGTSRSKFQFRDERGIILDWDNLDASGGWRSGVLEESEESISGKYVALSGPELLGDLNDFTEDNYSFNLWGTANGRPEGDLFDASNLSALQMKFEVNVRTPWSANAMQIIFTPWSVTGTNSYIAAEDQARALWIPWLNNGGSYQTDGWVTVSIPMNSFKYDRAGNQLDLPGMGNYGGLTMFVYHGGVLGTPCSPVIWIDNIRVVPVE
ncbi:glycan-binding surface protein [Bacteroidales bacterium OttesenSCG-928-A17]|nr:glycan-binding surface protein [Bacteroidales bacterium OttesenSCG-928-A17]